MPLNESASFVVSLILTVVTFSTMQIFKPLLAASQGMTILGGFIGSLCFVFILTAISNLEKVVFGKGFSSQWLEVAISLIGAVFAAASVHRVSATTALLFSLVMLYFLDKISQDTYGTGGPPTASSTAHPEKSKKKK